MVPPAVEAAAVDGAFRFRRKMHQNVRKATKIIISATPTKVPATLPVLDQNESWVTRAGASVMAGGAVGVTVTVLTTPVVVIKEVTGTGIHEELLKEVIGIGIHEELLDEKVVERVDKVLDGEVDLKLGVELEAGVGLGLDEDVVDDRVVASTVEVLEDVALVDDGYTGVAKNVDGV